MSSFNFDGTSTLPIEGGEMKFRVIAKAIPYYCVDSSQIDRHDTENDQLCNAHMLFIST